MSTITKQDILKKINYKREIKTKTKTTSNSAEKKEDIKKEKDSVNLMEMLMLFGVISALLISVLSFFSKTTIIKESVSKEDVLIEKMMERYTGIPSIILKNNEPLIYSKKKIIK